MLAQMDHAGIQIAVLQNAKPYGKLNDYFAKCIRTYPDRFVGLAEIDELKADNETEILKLRHAIKNQGLTGIYYEATKLIKTGSSASFNDRKFNLFWQEVGDLGIPIHWQLVSSRMPKEVFMEQIKLFDIWVNKYPHIKSVLVHGLFARPFKEDDGFRFPKELITLCKKSNVFVEILYPIQAGPLSWDYPFPQAQRLIKEQYEELGPQKLIWGSDMPNVERNCTYKQSLTYLRNYCDFITDEDMDLILGGNIKKIMKIDTGRSGSPRPILASIA
jgi:predicted TIM-barrel fold metal-dependent hydrolase